MSSSDDIEDNKVTQTVSDAADKSEINQLLSENSTGSSSVDKYHKLKAGMFLTSIAGFSMVGAFGTSIAMAKKQDPRNFAKGITGSREIIESGASLATRALAWGSLFSVLGVGTICFTVWKFLGVHNLPEFRQKFGSMMPVIPKKENQGRQEFRTIRDVFNYIIDEDEKEKREKKAKAST